MKDEQDIDPRHDAIRGTLRVVGPVVAGVGLLLTAVGLISFFSAFGTFQPPRYFWCAFLGIPLLGIGAQITNVGYLGAFFRYFAREAAPVQKDTFNYLAEGTSEGVRTIAQAVGRGFATGSGSHQAGAETSCPKCQASNPPGSLFCNHCGAAFAEKLCPRCRERNVSGAKFCGHCGGELP